MDNNRDLLVRLCTLAGAMMEDASAVAITIDADASTSLNVLDQLSSDIDTIQTLLAAAQRIARWTIIADVP